MSTGMIGHSVCKVHLLPAVNDQRVVYVCLTCKEIRYSPHNCVQYRNTMQPVTMSTRNSSRARVLDVTGTQHINLEEKRLTNLRETLLLVLNKKDELVLATNRKVLVSYKYNAERKTMYQLYKNKGSRKLQIRDWTYQVDKNVCIALKLDPYLVWARGNKVLAKLLETAGCASNQYYSKPSLMKRIKKLGNIRKALGLTKSQFKEALSGNTVVAELAFREVPAQFIELVKTVDPYSAHHLRYFGYVQWGYGAWRCPQRGRDKILAHTKREVRHYKAALKEGKSTNDAGRAIQLLNETLRLAQHLGVELHRDELSPSCIQYTHDRLVNQQAHLRREELLGRDKEAKTPFKYDKEWQKLADKPEDGFFLPKTPADIYDRVNTISHNCMYGYAQEIRNRDYLLVHYSKDGTELDIGLDWSHTRGWVVQQVHGPRNSLVSKEQWEMVKAFLNKYDVYTKDFIHYRTEDIDNEVEAAGIF